MRWILVLSHGHKVTHEHAATDQKEMIIYYLPPYSLTLFHMTC